MKAKLLALSLIALSSTASAEGLTEWARKNVEKRQTCSEPDECKFMWEYAPVWIRQYSSFKIQTQTDTMIETYSPIRGEDGLGLKVIREPIPGGYVFYGEAECARSQCTMNPLLAMDDFNIQMMIAKAKYAKSKAAK